MRLYSFESVGRATFGVEFAEGRLLDLGRAQEQVPCAGMAMHTLEDFIAAGQTALDWARDDIARENRGDELPAINLADVKLRPPLSRPPKIICIGQNYMDHCREQGKEPPKSPIIFPKFSNCLVASGEPILLPAISEQVDWEGELAVVIGKRGKRIAEEEALDYVFGYTIMNDISARDLQYSDGQWTRGKVSDSFAPTGPCIVTADEIADPQALKIRTIVSGAVMQDSTTAEMIFSVKYLIAYLSRSITFEPGDIISTGTPDGVGKWRKPPIFLKPGDSVRVEIEKIGAIENPVRADN